MAASVAQHFLKQNRAIGMLSYSHHREVIGCERGERQIGKIMEMLSVLQADGAVPFDRVLHAEGTLLPRGATIIAISASPNAAWALSVQQMVRSGQRVVAIVINGETFGGASYTPVITGLLATGAVVRVVKRGDSLTDAIAAEL
jgi:alkylated DNA nucleotide flippase Atl1